VFLLCRGLKESGLDVTVAAPRGSVLVRKCAEVGIRTLDDVRFSKGFRPIDFLHDVRSIKRFILANRTDILHTHGSQDTWSGTVAAFRVPKAVRPAVATRIGGAAEIIEDGVSGLIVPPQDVSALAAAIERLLRSASQRARMGSAARSAIIRRFTPRNLNETLAVYQSVLRLRSWRRAVDT